MQLRLKEEFREAIKPANIRVQVAAKAGISDWSLYHQIRHNSDLLTKHATLRAIAEVCGVDDVNVLIEHANTSTGEVTA